MKNILACFILFSSISFVESGKYSRALVSVKAKSLPLEHAAGNLFIVTVDGFRWQEIFNGADQSLINNIKYTQDTATMKILYWADSEKERRQKLMPFFWSVLAQKGQIYGNRHLNNKVNTANIYRFSYPGYNEIFTGNADLFISSNNKKKNHNINVLEFLNGKEAFKGKVGAFTSWDVFPFILNEERSGLIVNSGYENLDENPGSDHAALINKVQSEAIYDKEKLRDDQLTFITATEYLQQNQPKVVFIGLGETDDYAHDGRYDLYLQQAHKVDAMVQELWHWIQTTTGYKDNTTLLITTDHGRGKEKSWTSHGSFIPGSSETWMAMIGPGLQPMGEVSEEQQLYQKQIAKMIAELVGEKFEQKIARR
jgi:hypothetical protein